jgi:hypothetical protein
MPVPQLRLPFPSCLRPSRRCRVFYLRGRNRTDSVAWIRQSQGHEQTKLQLTAAHHYLERTRQQSHDQSSPAEADRSVDSLATTTSAFGGHRTIRQPRRFLQRTDPIHSNPGRSKLHLIRALYVFNLCELVNIHNL